MDKLYRFRHPAGRHIQVMFRHIPGKWKDTGTDNVAEAVRYAESHLMNDDIVKQKKTITFGEFATGFFTTSDPQGYRMRNAQRGKNYGEEHYMHQQDMLDLYFIPQWGSWLIDSITDVQIENFILGLKSKRTGRLLGDSMRNKGLTVMKIVLHEAKRQGLVSEDAAKDITEITERNAKRLPFVSEEMEVMFPDDDDKLIHVWGSVIWAAYFLIMRDTGFRPGEVAGLERMNYIPELHGLFTMQSVSKDRTIKHRIKTTGKGFDYKTGVLTNQTERILKMHLMSSKGDILFLEHGKPFRTETSNKHLKTIVDSLGIPLKGRTQYSLRHSFETDLSGRVTDKILMQLMAHTGFRPEYDHRTPERILEQLQPVRTLLEDRNK